MGSEIVKSYRNGLSMVKIAKQMKLSNASVRKILEKYNIEIRRPGQQYNLPEKVQFKSDCKKLRWFELEKKYGVSWSIIKYWKKRLGLTDGVKHDRSVIWEVDRNNCWKCTSHKSAKGYPRGRGGGLIVTRNWEEVNGDWPSDKLTRHLCDNKWCVNPSHIVPGTAMENIVDTILDGKGKKQKKYVNSLLASAFEQGIIRLDKSGFVERVVDGKKFSIKGTIETVVRVETIGSFERIPVGKKSKGVNERGEIIHVQQGISS